MAAIESLKKVTYESLEQFLESINSNFAIIENSPLYKGIPGNGGAPGNQGLIGQRGSQFIFVYFSNFNTNFGDVTSGANITLSYINSKLNTFADKAKLLKSLNITELVNNDIIVLTNSMMLSFDFINQIFVDTKLAFNEQTNLLSNIQQQIQESVQNAIDNNTTLNNIKNIYESYDSIAKAYPDYPLEGYQYGGIAQQLLPSMIVAPIYSGFSNNSNGYKLLTHKYFGFSDTEFPETNTGTQVFGSLRTYIKLQSATVDATSQLSLSSAFAPGPNNLPTNIILQNDEKSGLMIGYKGKLNLKSFAHIYKDTYGNLVLQSASGPETAEKATTQEYSKLLINNIRAYYAKDLEIGGNVSVAKDITITQNIINSFIKTGKLATGNKYAMQIGNGDLTDNNGTDFSMIELTTTNIKLPDYFKSQNQNQYLLGTRGDGSGLLEKIPMDYTSLSTGQKTFFTIDGNGDFQLNPLSTLTGTYGILLRNHYNQLASKINDAENKLLNYYWTRNQLADSTVTNLQSNGIFKVTPKITGIPTDYNDAIAVFGKGIGQSFSRVYIGNEANSELRIIGKTYFGSDNNPASNFYNPIPYSNKLLTTDENGLLTFVDSYALFDSSKYYTKEDFTKQTYASAVNETGTITTTTESPIVTGINTNFTASYIGKQLYDKYLNIIGIVQSIESTTSLTLSSNATVNITNSIFYLNTLNKRYVVKSMNINGNFGVGINGAFNVYAGSGITASTITLGETGTNILKANINFPKRVNKVLVTKQLNEINPDIGTLDDNYEIERLPANQTQFIDVTQEDPADTNAKLIASIANLSEFDSTPNNPISGKSHDYYRFLTSRHGNFLIRAINNIKEKLKTLVTASDIDIITGMRWESSALIQQNNITVKNRNSGNAILNNTLDITNASHGIYTIPLSLNTGYNISNIFIICTPLFFSGGQDSMVKFSSWNITNNKLALYFGNDGSGDPCSYFKVDIFSLR